MWRKKFPKVMKMLNRMKNLLFASMIVVQVIKYSSTYEFT